MMRFPAILSGVVLAAAGFGQKADSFDSQVADLQLLQSRQIQADMGVSVAERGKLQKIADSEEAAAQVYIRQLAKQGKSATDMNKDPRVVQLAVKLRDDIFAALAPAQLRRLRELTLQRMGPVGLTNVVVAKRLGLSVDQLTKVRAAYKDGLTKSGIVLQQINATVYGPYRNMHPKTREEANALNAKIMQERTAEIKKHPELGVIEKETKKRIESVLTGKQLAAYTALQGKPYAQK